MTSGGKTHQTASVEQSWCVGEGSNPSQHGLALIEVLEIVFVIIVVLAVELCVAWRNDLLPALNPKVATEAAQTTPEFRQFLCDWRGSNF